MAKPPQLNEIQPPPNLSPTPDRATRRGLSDFTGKDARDRVLYINIWFFKYGTNDKAHAAAIVLSMTLLAAIIFLVFFGTRNGDSAWNDRAFNWMSGAFLFVAGVALGKSSLSSGRREDDD